MNFPFGCDFFHLCKVFLPHHTRMHTRQPCVLDVYKCAYRRHSVVSSPLWRPLPTVASSSQSSFSTAIFCRRSEMGRRLRGKKGWASGQAFVNSLSTSQWTCVCPAEKRKKKAAKQREKRQAVAATHQPKTLPAEEGRGAWCGFFF